MNPKIIPELDVSNLKTSLYFYTQILGFKVEYDRPEERFVFLDLDGAKIMLEEAAGPGRRFRTAQLEHPYGRGMNLQIEVNDAQELHQRVVAAGYVPYISLEERWYRTGTEKEAGNQQFVVADPDGYLLRFFCNLGERAIVA